LYRGTPPDGQKDPAMKFWLIDAFASERFRGNPAAVLLGGSFPDDDEIAGLVRELNQPAVVLLRQAGSAFDIRWFTPRESELCGHGTLAAAHALLDGGFTPPFSLCSRSGVLTAGCDAEAITLDLPALPVTARAPRAELAEALGATLLGMADDHARVLVELADEQTVRALTPDMARLAAVEPRGVIVTARSSPPHDVVSRYFKPHGGIDEDQVTGSAHCALAPYWAARLGRTELRCYQASARGGELSARLVGERVQLSGRCTTVLRGSLL
jgi:PhzF family phenazine biosynthesis protein